MATKPKSTDTQEKATESKVQIGSAFVNAKDYAFGMLGSHWLNEYSASDASLLSEDELIEFRKPTELLVSKWYPGNRVFDLTGSNAEEAIGLLLAGNLKTTESLEQFRRILGTPDIADSIVRILLPRSEHVVRRGQYRVSDKMIRETVKEVLEPHSVAPAVATAIGHVFVRHFDAMGLVLSTNEKKTVVRHSTFPVSADDVEKVIMIESLRDVFSEARINESIRRLNQDATPTVIGEILGDMLRRTAQIIPEIRLRMEQLKITKGLISMYLRNDRNLGSVMLASPTLAQLSNYANFVYLATLADAEPIVTVNNSDAREAAEAILQIIASAPSIDAIPLSTYESFFGSVPCSAPDGIYRGAVFYLPLAQQSAIDIVDSYPVTGGYRLTSVPGEYAPIKVLSSEINRSLLSPESMKGLANLVADEITMGDRITTYSRPILRTIGLSKEDMVYLAMAQSQSLALIRDSNDLTGPMRILYSAKVGEFWRTWVNAASPKVAFFAEPQAVLIYQSGATAKDPKPMPAREQSIKLANHDIEYLGDIMSTIISDEIEKIVSFDVGLRDTDSTITHTLNLRVAPLDLLLGTNENLTRGGAHYAVVKEMGVDQDLKLMFALVAAYMQSESTTMSDKAKSWLVETMTPLATHPVIVRLAIKALNVAVLKGKIDARRYEPQYKETVTRAYFGTMFGILNRMDKIDRETFDMIVEELPISSLSIKAAINIATIPQALDGSEPSDRG